MFIVFTFLSLIILVSFSAFGIFIAQSLLSLRKARLLWKEGNPVIIFKGPSATASALCPPANPPVTWKLIFASAVALFSSGAQRQFFLRTYAASLVAWWKEWDVVITMPGVISVEQTALWRRAKSDITPKMIWNSLMEHELHHAKCYRSRNFTRWASVDHLIAEEVEAYELTFLVLGFDIESENIQNAIRLSALESVEISGARAYLS